MTMPTNAQLAAQMRRLLGKVENLENRMKIQENSARDNYDILQSMQREQHIMHSTLKWGLGVLTTLSTSAAIAFLYHWLATLH